MCGICGIISSEALNPSDKTLVSKMNQALIHRGPDSEGIYQDEHVILAMRRLKIIDLAGGDQPLYSHGRSLVMVFNGEIYNHVELRESILKQGVQLNSHSDGETILGLYQLKQEKLLQDLRGMFSFVLYDIPNQKILIARDRNSEKPFYYQLKNQKLTFASELKALTQVMDKADLKLSPQALHAFFHFQYVPEPHTPIEGIHKLPAAHFVWIDLKNFQFEIKPYWDLLEAPGQAHNPEQKIREAFEAVAPLIIRSEVPVGVALSGGIDSSAIAALAAKHYPAQMHAFSIGYEGRPQVDERSMAQKLAQQIGMNYHEVEIKTSQMVQDFPEMIYFLDDPIADIAAYGYYQVSRAAQKQGVPVLLNGIGGDELFGGYFWSRRAIAKTLQKQKYQKSGNLNIFSVLASCLDQPKESGTSFWKHILANYKIEKEKITLNPHRFVFYEEMPGFLKSSETLKQLYSSNFLKGIDPETIYTPFTSNDWSNPPLQNMQALFNTWLYSNCIALGDRMSMAHSVELRLPFMDHKLIETVVGINKRYPQEYKTPHKQRFIKAIHDLLPQEIFKRKKRGFTPPTQDWILALVQQYSGFLKEGYLVKEGIMDSEKLENFMKDAREKKSNLFFAHKLILMEIWCRIYLYQEDYRNIRPQP